MSFRLARHLLVRLETAASLLCQLVVLFSIVELEVVFAKTKLIVSLLTSHKVIVHSPKFEGDFQKASRPVRIPYGI